jgi:hypothetical protein
MKMKKTTTTLALLLMMAASANAVVTLAFKTHNGSSGGPDGLPIVDSLGAAVLNSTNSVFASIGYLTTGGTLTPASVLSRFVPIDNTPVIPNLSIAGPPIVQRNGLISASDWSDLGTALPTNYVANFQGKDVVVLIGNNANLSLSTEIALFSFPTTFGTPDGVTGNLVQTFTVTAASVPTIGNKIAVTTQPVAGNSFVNGVSMVSTTIPEPSAALLGALGALGLLRRRRI